CSVPGVPAPARRSRLTTVDRSRRRAAAVALPVDLSLRAAGPAVVVGGRAGLAALVAGARPFGLTAGSAAVHRRPAIAASRCTARLCGRGLRRRWLRPWPAPWSRLPALFGGLAPRSAVQPFRPLARPLGSPLARTIGPGPAPVGGGAFAGDFQLARMPLTNLFRRWPAAPHGPGVRRHVRGVRLAPGRPRFIICVLVARRVVLAAAPERAEQAFEEPHARRRRGHLRAFGQPPTEVVAGQLH